MSAMLYSPPTPPISDAPPMGCDGLLPVSHGCTPDTPPLSDTDLFNAPAAAAITTAVHALSTEASALASLRDLYEFNGFARGEFVKAIDAITLSHERGGKTVVIGVGKSGKIGEKLVATLNSLGLLSSILHPVEALHGDLGIIRQNDTLLLITYSGRTPELLHLLPYLPASLPLIALTAHTTYETTPLLNSRENAILLPTPIPVSEVSSFGISAPTTSTTITMALGDAIALAAAQRVHGTGPGAAEAFKRNHPGGAIGIANSKGDKKEKKARIIMSAVAICWAEIPLVEGVDSSIQTAMSLDGVARMGPRVFDCMRTALRSKNRWVRTTDDSVIPPSRLASISDADIDKDASSMGLLVSLSQMIEVQADATVQDVASILRERYTAGVVGGETVLKVVENGEVVGVVEVEDMLKCA